MEDIGLGGGLAIIGFWMFVALVVLGGIWDNIRKRDGQHETVRRVIESGQQIDQKLIDTLLSVSDGSTTLLDVGFRVSALWILPISVGMVPFAIFLGSIAEEALMPLLGVAAMLFCFGVGFLVAARVVTHWYPNEDSSTKISFQD